MWREASGPFFHTVHWGQSGQTVAASTTEGRLGVGETGVGEIAYPGIGPLGQSGQAVAATTTESRLGVGETVAHSVAF